MKNTILIILLIAVGFLASLLLTKVIISISYLYEIHQILDLGFIKTFAITSMLQTIFVKFEYKKNESKDFSQTIEESFGSLMGKTITYLIFWGMMFVAYYLIF